jgi:hypothetical protein
MGTEHNPIKPGSLMGLDELENRAAAPDLNIIRVRSKTQHIQWPVATSGQGWFQLQHGLS